VPRRRFTLSMKRETRPHPTSAAFTHCSSPSPSRGGIGSFTPPVTACGAPIGSPSTADDSMGVDRPGSVTNDSHQAGAPIPGGSPIPPI
jgi:hypothetical protein